MHITLRAIHGLPTFRAERVQRLVRAILRAQRRASYKDAFGIAHFSIQSNHLHLLVEADRGALRGGITGFVVSFARRLNAMLGRRGRVWGDRYHARDLTTPRETRNALVYVFQNHKKHGHAPRGAVSIDPWSSAARFDGWVEGPQNLVSTRLLQFGIADPWLEDPWPPPRTWLLSRGWQHSQGLLSLAEAPRMPAS